MTTMPSAAATPSPLRGRDRANVLTIAAACYYFAGNGSVVNVILDHIAETDELPRESPRVRRRLSNL
ncbi:UNVERIFIED_ORG: hypothetical protein L601_006500000070 [Gordonia westfalica J30]